MHLFAAISNAASTSDEQSWSFVADQEHVLIASLDYWMGDALSDILIDFFGSLQRNIVGQVFSNGLTDEQKAYLEANNGIGLNRCCLSRNPSYQKLWECCQRNPNRDAVEMLHSVLAIQQRAASFHQDIRPQVFTMLATLAGEDTKYLPKPIVDFAASIR